MLNSTEKYLNGINEKYLIMGSVVVGLISYPLINKIKNIALECFRALKQWFWDNTFIIRLKSLNCPDCAKNHKVHINYPTPKVQPKNQHVNNDPNVNPPNDEEPE